MLTYPRAEVGISKELFPRELSYGLYWGNQMYKLKMSVMFLMGVGGGLSELFLIHHCILFDIHYSLTETVKLLECD